MEDVTGLNVKSDVAGPLKFFSATHIVADSVGPDKEHVLSLNPPQCVKERLGENAGFMLGVYC